MRVSLRRTVWRWMGERGAYDPSAGRAGRELGFMDAAELVEELRRLHREGKDIGQHLYLRRYERSP